MKRLVCGLLVCFYFNFSQAADIKAQALKFKAQFDKMEAGTPGEGVYSCQDYAFREGEWKTEHSYTMVNRFLGYSNLYYDRSFSDEFYNKRQVVYFTFISNIDMTPASWSSVYQSAVDPNRLIYAQTRFGKNKLIRSYTNREFKDVLAKNMEFDELWTGVMVCKYHQSLEEADKYFFGSGPAATPEVKTQSQKSSSASVAACNYPLVSKVISTITGSSLIYQPNGNCDRLGRVSDIKTCRQAAANSGASCYQIGTADLPTVADTTIEAKFCFACY